VSPAFTPEGLPESAFFDLSIGPAVISVPPRAFTLRVLPRDAEASVKFVGLQGEWVGPSHLSRQSVSSQGTPIPIPVGAVFARVTTNGTGPGRAYIYFEVGPERE
jgi:hypothetical protein